MNRIARSAAAVVVAVAFIAAAPAFAGSAPATLTGTVTGEIVVAPISGATVTAYAYDSRQKVWVARASAVTGATGSYTLSIAAGSYKVGFQATGYGAELFDNVTSGDFNLATTLTVKSGDTITASAVLHEIEDGSATYPWLVHDLVTLDAVRTKQAAGVYFKQVQDIDASATATSGSTWNNGGLGWLPIAQMQGEYDGNGKVISGLYINRYVAESVGLFGTATGTLKNVALRDANITGGRYVGALAGQANGGLVSGCSKTGAVAGTLLIGGLVGYATTGTTVSGSSAEGSVFGYNGTQRGWYAGGLVGYLSGGTITASTSAGSVGGGNSCSGGLVGAADGNFVIEDSSSSATVNIVFPGTYTPFRDFGGLVGNTSGGRISRSSASGSVTSNGGPSPGYGTGTGGLAGTAGAATTIEDSFATGNVTSDGTDLGGLVGFAYLSTLSHVSATGSVSGDSYVGGLVGQGMGSTYVDCYAWGSASAPNGGAGGLIGVSGDASITACYAIGAANGGGLVATVSDPTAPPTVADSYWDVTASGNATSAVGTPRTTEELQTQSTYGAAWDFWNVWYPPAAGVYPTLR